MIEAKRIPAIPTEYRGIKFRSKLEAKYAKAFDRLGMPWVYEEVNFEFDDGTRYAPDFYFPECDQFFEVKGLMLDDDRHKIELLALTGHKVVVGDASGNLCYYEPDCVDGRWYYVDWDEQVHVAECRACHTKYFLSEYGGWGCTNPNCPGIDHPKYDHRVTGFYDCGVPKKYNFNFLDEVFDD